MFIFYKYFGYSTVLKGCWRGSSSFSAQAIDKDKKRS